MIRTIFDHGGHVKAYDPIANESMKEIFPEIIYFESWELACKDADGVVIMTDWNEFRGMSLDVLKSLVSTPVILDTRNILSIEKLNEYGFIFDNVGRKPVL